MEIKLKDFMRKHNWELNEDYFEDIVVKTRNSEGGKN